MKSGKSFFTAFFIVLYLIRQIQDQFIALCPSKAWIGNGLAINPFSDFLASVFDVALDHKPFDQMMNIRRISSACHDISGNTDLLHVLLAGIGMVAVHNDGRIFQ